MQDVPAHLQSLIGRLLDIEPILDAIFSAEPDRRDAVHELRGILRKGSEGTDTAVWNMLLADPPALLETKHPLTALANRIKMSPPLTRRILEASGLLYQRGLCIALPPAPGKTTFAPRIRVSDLGMEVVGRMLLELRNNPDIDPLLYDLVMSPVPVPGDYRDPIFNVVRKDLLIDYADTWRRLARLV